MKCVFHISFPLNNNGAISGELHCACNERTSMLTENSLPTDFPTFRFAIISRHSKQHANSLHTKCIRSSRSCRYSCCVLVSSASSLPAKINTAHQNTLKRHKCHKMLPCNGKHGRRDGGTMGGMGVFCFRVFIRSHPCKNFFN